MQGAALNQTFTPLPPQIEDLDAETIQARIVAARAALGARLVILGHHYQADDVVRHAQFTGDSFKLAQHAAAQKEAEFIVFCGVHFMAESADILAGECQTVILPDMGAGCSMADMADVDDVEEAWEFLLANGVQKLVPVTYMNSTAAIKAFCGRNGGIVCTSSNAREVLDWAFARGERVLFLPDQHLGRNTGFATGIPLQRMPLWDPKQAGGGASIDAYRDSRIVLWRGHCSVHAKFTLENVTRLRAAHPDVRILVHPECNFDVVQNADLVGSTEFIIRQVREAAPGTRWAIGTEHHLVYRLAQQHPEQDIQSLSGIQCACATMYRIDPPHLLWTLENLVRGEVVNAIRVPEVIARDARLALDRMLAVRGAGATHQAAGAAR
jgi:quinolinate synthase